MRLWLYQQLHSSNGKMPKNENPTVWGMERSTSRIVESVTPGEQSSVIVATHSSTLPTLTKHRNIISTLAATAAAAVKAEEKGKSTSNDTSNSNRNSDRNYNKNSGSSSSSDVGDKTSTDAPLTYFSAAPCSIANAQCVVFSSLLSNLPNCTWCIHGTFAESGLPAPEERLVDMFWTRG